MGETFSYPFLASTETLHQFIQRWEARTLPKAEWTHGAHVGVCAFYTSEHGPEEALRRMRAGIPLYNVASGGANTETSGYHETLTCFWAQVVAEFLATRERLTTFEAVVACVTRYGQERKLHEAFYSFDVVADRHARRMWIAPDLQPKTP